MESINSSNNELRHKSYSRKQGKNSQKRSSVSIKAQNYVKPEISYISKMPEYSTFKLPEKKKPDFEQNLPNIEEERATEAPSFSKPQKFERAQTIDEDYMGLFDILMKELSDVPGGIQEKVSKVTVETFKNDLIKITRRSNKKKIKLSFKEQISKLNVCTYNCDPDQIQFDLEKGSGWYFLTPVDEWQEKFSKVEMKNNYCSFHSENFCLSFQELNIMLRMYSCYFNNKDRNDIEKLNQMFKSYNMRKSPGNPRNPARSKQIEGKGRLHSLRFQLRELHLRGIENQHSRAQAAFPSRLLLQKPSARKKSNAGQFEPLFEQDDAKFESGEAEGWSAKGEEAGESGFGRFEFVQWGRVWQGHCFESEYWATESGLFLAEGGFERAEER